MDSMFTWNQYAHELDVQISTNWMQVRQKGKPTSFASLGCLPLLPLLQVDLLEHALPEPFDGRIHILGLARLQTHHTPGSPHKQKSSCVAKHALRLAHQDRTLRNWLLPSAA